MKKLVPQQLQHLAGTMNEMVLDLNGHHQLARNIPYSKARSGDWSIWSGPFPIVLLMKKTITVELYRKGDNDRATTIPVMGFIKIRSMVPHNLNSPTCNNNYTACNNNNNNNNHGGEVILYKLRLRLEFGLRYAVPKKHWLRSKMEM
jgi:hypothetical protein